VGTSVLVPAQRLLLSSVVIVSRKLSKTDQRNTIEVGIADSVAAFRSSPDASRVDTMVSKICLNINTFYCSTGVRP